MSFSIFGAKDPKSRIQGVLTKVGGKNFEAQRAVLGALFREVAGRDAVRVSDADVVEFLSRGQEATRAYLEVNWK